MNRQKVRGGRARIWVAATMTVTLAALTGCGAAEQQTAPAQQSQPSTSSARQVGMAKSIPVRITIPALNAESSLVPLGLNSDGTVEVPPVSQPKQAGWYTKGPTPGQVGPAVILGHVDGNGQEGIFFNLKKMTAGDTVDVSRKDGTTAKFRVTKVDDVPKDKFPTDAVYGNTTTPQLRLITCGGVFDSAAHNYLDNIIVYATLV